MLAFLFSDYFYPLYKAEHTCYIRVAISPIFQKDDIPATLAQIEAHSGATLMPETEIPGVGWFAVFKDPTGNTVALYKDKPQ